MPESEILKYVNFFNDYVANQKRSTLRGHICGSYLSPLWTIGIKAGEHLDSVTQNSMIISLSHYIEPILTRYTTSENIAFIS